MKLAIYKKIEDREVPDGIISFTVTRMENSAVPHQSGPISREIKTNSRIVHLFEESFTIEKSCKQDPLFFGAGDGFKFIRRDSEGNQMYIKSTQFIIDDDFLEKCFVSGKRTIDDLISRNGEITRKLYDMEIDRNSLQSKIEKIKGLTFFKLIKEWRKWKKEQNNASTKEI